MKAADLTDSQKEVLSQVAMRLRRQANDLESLIRSGSPQKLARACGMLHATDTQLRWVQNGTQQVDAEFTRRRPATTSVRSS